MDEERSALETRVTEPGDTPFRRVKLAYLLSRYPAVSHTFFLNEIAGLRRLGFEIDVASINAPGLPTSGVARREEQEIGSVFYVKKAGVVRLCAVLGKLIFSRPRVLLRGLRAALALDPGSPAGSGYALLYLAEALLVGDWMERRGQHHLHIHFGGPVATVGMLASAAWGIPFSLMIHGPDEFHDESRFYLRRKFLQAQFVFCISDYCRSQVLRIAGAERAHQVEVVRLGIDPEIFARRQRAESAGSVEIVCVGRLVAAKGQAVLLEAISVLVNRGRKLRLRLIGDGEDRANLEVRAGELGISSVTVFEGALSHEATRGKLESADIFCLASFAEGVPVSLMEAMAMEIPCVSTYVAGIPELIRDGVEGFLVPASSVEALAEAVDRLAGDPGLRRRMGAAGRALVLERYNLRRNIPVLATAFEQRFQQRRGENWDSAEFNG